MRTNGKDGWLGFLLRLTAFIQKGFFVGSLAFVITAVGQGIIVAECCDELNLVLHWCRVHR